MPVEQTKIEKLVSRVLLSFETNPADAKLAHRAVMAELDREGLSPSELQITDRRCSTYTEIQKVLERDKERMDRLRRENRFLRTKVDRKTLRDAEKAALLEYDFLDLEDRIAQRLGGLPDGWIDHVARHLDVKRSTVRKWLDGIEAVPDEVFDSVERLPALGRKGRASTGMSVGRPSHRKKPSEPYPWGSNPAAELEACTQWAVHGMSAPEVQKLVEAAYGVRMADGAGPLKRRLWHSPPPRGLIRVRAGEETDWPELWTLGSALTKGGRQWQQYVKNWLDLPEECRVGVDPNQFIDPLRLRDLRDAYQAARKRRREGSGGATPTNDTYNSDADSDDDETDIGRGFQPTAVTDLNQSSAEAEAYQQTP